MTVGFWSQLRLCLWKHCLLKKRAPISTLVQVILLPHHHRRRQFGCDHCHHHHIVRILRSQFQSFFFSPFSSWNPQCLLVMSRPAHSRPGWWLCSLLLDRKFKLIRLHWDEGIVQQTMSTSKRKGVIFENGAWLVYFLSPNLFLRAGPSAGLLAMAQSYMCNLLVRKMYRKYWLKLKGKNIQIYETKSMSEWLQSPWNLWGHSILSRLQGALVIIVVILIFMMITIIILISITDITWSLITDQLSAITGSVSPVF